MPENASLRGRFGRPLRTSESRRVGARGPANDEERPALHRGAATGEGKPDGRTAFTKRGYNEHGYNIAPTADRCSRGDGGGTPHLNPLLRTPVRRFVASRGLGSKGRGDEETRRRGSRGDGGAFRANGRAEARPSERKRGEGKPDGRTAFTKRGYNGGGDRCLDLTVVSVFRYCRRR